MTLVDTPPRATQQEHSLPLVRPGLLLSFLAFLFAMFWALDWWLQPSLYSDGVDYAQAARELAAGHAWALYESNRPPLFSTLIAIVVGITGLEAGLALRAVSLLSGVALILLTWRLVWGMTADATAAGLAAAMAAVGIPAICGLRFTLVPDSLGLCFLIGAIMVSAAAVGNRRPSTAAFAGLFWALAALTRTQHLPLGPPALLLFLYLSAREATGDRRGDGATDGRTGRRGDGATGRPGRGAVDVDLPPRPSFGVWSLLSHVPYGRGLAFLAGWLIPLVTYYTLLSLYEHRVTVTNAYDVPYILMAANVRVKRVIIAVVSSMVMGLPLLVLSGVLLFRLPRPQMGVLGPMTQRAVPWILMVGALTFGICLASWAERRYFLPPYWCLWTLACVALAARRAVPQPGDTRTAWSLRQGKAAAVTCLALTAVGSAGYAWRRHGDWPAPTPAYSAASRWINTTYGPAARVAVTGGRQTVRYDLKTREILAVRTAVSSDWRYLKKWLRVEKPDVVLIGPDPGRGRDRMGPVYRALLEEPRSGQRVGLVHVRSFPAPEGTVHALRPVAGRETEHAKHHNAAKQL